MCLSASLGAACKKERGHDLLGRFLRAGVGQVLATVRTGVGVRHCSLVPYRGRAKAAVRAIVAHQSCPRVPSKQSSFSFALHATQNLLEASRYDSLISKLGQVSNKSESGGLVATSLGLARAFEIVTEIRDRELLRAPKTVWITDFCGSRRAIFRNNTLRDRVRDWLLFCCVLCVFFFRCLGFWARVFRNREQSIAPRRQRRRSDGTAKGRAKKGPESDDNS